MLLLAIAVVSMITNLIFITIKLGIKIPYKSKRFKNKVDPIYKLEWGGTWDPYYRVYKYELNWLQLKDTFLLLCTPFSSLIKLFRYKKLDESFGQFSKEDIKNGNPTEDLKVYWETANRVAIEQYDEELKSNNEFSEKLKERNKIFNENYEN